jgi:periplasmic copper chaperone A
MKHTALSLSLACLATAVFSTTALAQTTVKDAWVRGTVAQQQATGAFFQISSAQGGKLVSATSPVAATVEIHEMKMVGNVMKMGVVPGLELPAGQTVELKPGGYHVMMMGLKQPLKGGDSVPLTLTVQGADGKSEVLELSVPVRALGMPAGHEGMKH